MNDGVTRALFRCDGAPVPARWRSQTWHQTGDINHRGPKAGHILAIENLSHALLGEVRARAADLVHIAAYIYAADQLVSRGGEADVHGRKWRRHLALTIAVSDPDFWNQDKVRASLEQVVAFASEDHWEFAFTAAAPQVPLQIPLNMEKQVLHGAPDCVVLMSGGTDSLCAAIEAVHRGGRRPVLVSHASNPAAASRQSTLVAELRRRARQKGWAWELPHVVVSVHRRGGDAPDVSQRTRPFLFASLGAAIGHEFSVSAVLLPDNGYVSLNIPISDELVGALATRSTHPKFIRDFNILLGHAFGVPLRVSNPLWARTRGQALELLKEADLASLLELTVSCGHTRGRPADCLHCGVCSQCIDRRFATIGAGLERHDPRDGYQLDIFRQSLPAGPARKLAVSYYQLALTASRVATDDFFDEYPQLYDCVLPDDPHVASTGQALVAMLKAHAANTLEVIELELERAKRELARGVAPKDCLLRLVLGSAYPDDHLGATSGDRRDVQGGVSAEPLSERFKASDDYRFVVLRGDEFALTPAQARVVQYLHEHQRRGTPEVSEKQILDRLDVYSRRVQYLFKDSPAWGRLVIRGSTKGTFRLNL